MTEYAPARGGLGRYRVVDPAWPSVPRGSPFDGIEWDSATKAEARADGHRAAKWYGPLAILDTQTKRLIEKIPDARRRTEE